MFVIINFLLTHLIVDNPCMVAMHLRIPDHTHVHIDTSYVHKHKHKEL